MKIACIGECSTLKPQAGADKARLEVVDDALVTAIYLSRSGLEVSLIGVSNGVDVRNALANESINTELLRDSSLAAYFTEDNLAKVASSLSRFEYAYLTGRILSLIDEAGRVALTAMLKNLRAAGLKVIFDCNHSATEWASNEEAVKAYKELLAITDISLPNFQEESALFQDSDVAGLIARHHQHGIPEIALKNGIEPNWLSTKPEKPPKQFPVEEIQQEVDASGVGDAFNAAYIATRLRGKTYCGSIKQGQILAAAVVSNPGAIIPKQ